MVQDAIVIRLSITSKLDGVRSWSLEALGMVHGL
jgi:hypothetical protein